MLERVERKKKAKTKKKKAETTSIAVLAERMGIGINQAYEAAKRGEFEGFVWRVGGHWIVSNAGLDRKLNGVA